MSSCGVYFYGFLALLCIRAEIDTFSRIVGLFLERNDTETVGSAVVSEEVEESDRAAHGGRSDERSAFAGGENGARVRRIDGHLDLSVSRILLDSQVQN